MRLCSNPYHGICSLTELHPQWTEWRLSTWKKMQCTWRDMTEWGRWVYKICSGPMRQHFHSSKHRLSLHNCSATQTSTNFRPSHPCSVVMEVSPAPELCSFTMTRLGDKILVLCSGQWKAGRTKSCTGVFPTHVLFVWKQGRDRDFSPPYYNHQPLSLFEFIYHWLPTTSEHDLGKSYSSVL